MFFMTLSTSLSFIVLVAFCFQPIWAARLKPLDRMLGLDNVYVIHKTMGMTSGTLAVLWPISLAAERNDWGLLAGIGRPWPVLFVDASALLAVIIVFTSLLYKQIGLGYETWRKIHNIIAIMILIMIFSAGMLLHTNGDMHGIQIALRSLFFFMAGIAYLYHKILGPLQRRKHPFRVAEIKQETRNVWTLKLSPPDGYTALLHLPGQFQFLTFYRGRGLPREEHPFTISSSGLGELHSSTIKESGNFTSSISKTQVGDTIAVQAPFGRFSYVFHPNEQDMVFIAGGIGITPFMSMLRHMQTTGAAKRVLLLYANNSEQDIVFRDELDKIADRKNPELKVVHVLSTPDAAWQGERGFIDKRLIEQSLKENVGDWSFYICGPPPMMRTIIGLIISMGVSPSRIHSEQFSL